MKIDTKRIDGASGLFAAALVIVTLAFQTPSLAQETADETRDNPPADAESALMEDDDGVTIGPGRAPVIPEDEAVALEEDRRAAEEEREARDAEPAAAQEAVEDESEEPAAEEAAEESTPENTLIPEPLIPPVEEPLETPEQYQARIEQISAITQEVAETALRVNNTAGLWKAEHDRIKAELERTEEELAETKDRYFDAVQERAALAKELSALRSRVEGLQGAVQASDMNRPLMQITADELNEDYESSTVQPATRPQRQPAVRSQSQTQPQTQPQPQSQQDSGTAYYQPSAQPQTVVVETEEERTERRKFLGIPIPFTEKKAGEEQEVVQPQPVQPAPAPVQPERALVAEETAPAPPATASSSSPGTLSQRPAGTDRPSQSAGAVDSTAAPRPNSNARWIWDPDTGSIRRVQE